jgi:hypothetical protein
MGIVIVGWCGKLWLIRQCHGFKYITFIMGYKMIHFFNEKLYYYVKVWIIILHDCAVLKAFKSFRKWKIPKALDIVFNDWFWTFYIH